MTDAELIERCRKTFALLRRLSACANIKANGKRISHREALEFECDAALKAIENHAANEPER